MSIAFETDSALHLLDFHTVECKMSGWGSRLKARGGGSSSFDIPEQKRLITMITTHNHSFEQPV